MSITSSIKTYKMYTDGGSRGNPGEAAIGIYIIGSDAEEIKKYKEKIGVNTNNFAEYTALKTGLKLAQELEIKNLECYLDSELVVKQINGIYKVKDETLRIIYQEILTMKKNFDFLVFKHVPRAENKVADKLVNNALDNL